MPENGDDKLRVDRTRQALIKQQEQLRAATQNPGPGQPPKSVVERWSEYSLRSIMRPAGEYWLDRRVREREQSAERNVVSNPHPETASPMHERDRRFWLVTLWAGSIGGALAVGCYIAWASGQMPLQWAAPGMAIGLLAMAGATIYALDKRPPKIWRPGPMLIVVAALTWALVGWQAWMWFHPSVQGYTQAQLDKAVKDGKAQIQAQLDAAQKTITDFKNAPGKLATANGSAALPLHDAEWKRIRQQANRDIEGYLDGPFQTFADTAQAIVDNINKEKVSAQLQRAIALRALLEDTNAKQYRMLRPYEGIDDIFSLTDWNLLKQKIEPAIVEYIAELTPLPQDQGAGIFASQPSFQRFGAAVSLIPRWINDTVRSLANSRAKLEQTEVHQ